MTSWEREAEREGRRERERAAERAPAETQRERPSLHFDFAVPNKAVLG